GRAACRCGGARAGDERAAGVDQGLAEGGQGGGFLGDGVLPGGRAAEVVGEGQVDHAVGLGGGGAQDVQVGQCAADRLGPGGRDLLGGGVGAGQGRDRVAVVEQFGDHGGADQAGAAGDEDAHANSPASDGTLVSSP